MNVFIVLLNKEQLGKTSEFRENIHILEKISFTGKSQFIDSCITFNSLEHTYLLNPAFSPL